MHGQNESGVNDREHFCMSATPSAFERGQLYARTIRVRLGLCTVISWTDGVPERHAEHGNPIKDIYRKYRISSIIANAMKPDLLLFFSSLLFF